MVTPRRTAPKTGRFLEILGFHNPLRHERVLKGERIKYWLSQGAQPSARVQNMLISEGIIEGEKVAAHKSLKKKDELEETAKEVKETSKITEGEVEAKDTSEAKEEIKEGETKEESPAAEEEKPVEETPKEEAPAEEESPAEEEKKEEPAAKEE